MLPHPILGRSKVPPSYSYDLEKFGLSPLTHKTIYTPSHGPLYI